MRVDLDLNFNCPELSGLAVKFYQTLNFLPIALSVIIINMLLSGYARWLKVATGAGKYTTGIVGKRLLVNKLLAFLLYSTARSTSHLVGQYITTP